MQFAQYHIGIFIVGLRAELSLSFVAAHFPYNKSSHEMFNFH